MSDELFKKLEREGLEEKPTGSSMYAPVKVEGGGMHDLIDIASNIEYEEDADGNYIESKRTEKNKEDSVGIGTVIIVLLFVLSTLIGVVWWAFF